MMSFEKILQETKETNQVLAEFTRAAYSLYQSDSYAAGYLGSMLVVALNDLPKARRAELRAQLQDAAKQLAHQQLLHELKHA